MTAADRLAAIRAREQAASSVTPWTESTWEFIAHARDDVRRMADALDAVLALCDGSIYADTILAGLVRAAITDALGEQA